MKINVLCKTAISLTKLMSKCSYTGFFLLQITKWHQKERRRFSLSHTTRDLLPYHMQLLHMYTQNEEMNDMANEVIQHKLISTIKNRTIT